MEVPAAFPALPVYSVHDDSPVGLAAQLCWQQAATRHAPDGCPASRPRHA
jgi:hypothetical protein